jgi:hypothetical protein
MAPTRKVKEKKQVTQNQTKYIPYVGGVIKRMKKKP